MTTFQFRVLFYCIMFSTVSYTNVVGQSMPSILNERDRAEWVDNMMEYRVDSMLPQLMDRSGFDMWILISREYNEDPVLQTMLPSSWLSARRRTIFVFHKDKSTGVFEKVAIARYAVGKLLKGEWNLDVYPDQYEALRDYIISKDPSKIGINTSEYFGLADGLIHTEHEKLMAVLPLKYKDRIVSAEDLAIAWLETRSPMEIEQYDNLCAMGHHILSSVFSIKYIQPGITTTNDVIWSLRQKVRDLGLEIWFHPSVSIQRKDTEKFDHLRSFSTRPDDLVIQRGDLLHVDFGITHLRLNTDQQQHFYVPLEGETKVPDFLNNAFRQSNRVQDILTSQFKEGITGNELLKRSLDQAKSEGITASIYTHPIGFHGHAAGPTIGMWDQQSGVKGNGDYPLYNNTAYSIELNSSSEIKEWGKIIRIMLEEDGIFKNNQFYYPAGRQEEIYLVD